MLRCRFLILPSFSPLARGKCHSHALSTWHPGSRRTCQFSFLSISRGMKGDSRSAIRSHTPQLNIMVKYMSVSAGKEKAINSPAEDNDAPVDTRRKVFFSPITCSPHIPNTHTTHTHTHTHTHPSQSPRSIIARPNLESKARTLLF